MIPFLHPGKQEEILRSGYKGQLLRVKKSFDGAFGEKNKLEHIV